MEIEVGEYVRTSDGIIDEVVKIEEAGSGIRFFGEQLEDTIIVTKGDTLSERRIDLIGIVKHSKDILDLREIGDIIEIYLSNSQTYLKVIVDKYFEESFGFKAIKAGLIQIKSIVTKEQLKLVEYRLEE